LTQNVEENVWLDYPRNQAPLDLDESLKNRPSLKTSPTFKYYICSGPGYLTGKD